MIYTCAISNLKLATSYLNIPNNSKLIPKLTLAHPIFYSPLQNLENLYTLFIEESLDLTDSYLLFLAYLNQLDLRIETSLSLELTNTAHAKWVTQLIQANIAQLRSAVHITLATKLRQPAYVIRQDNTMLENIADYINSLHDNIAYYSQSKADIAKQETLTSLSNQLSVATITLKQNANYANIVANWAALAADFPEAKQDTWKRIIRSAFSKTKMHTFPLKEVKEVYEHCEATIEVGALHRQELMRILDTAVTNHIDYLGLGYEVRDFKIVPTLASLVPTKPSEEETKKTLEGLISNAPVTEPKRDNYPDELSYSKAKIAYMLAKAKRTNSN